MMRALLLLAAMAAGCATVDRDYERPDVGLNESDRFISTAAPAAMPAEADLRWWRSFGDPLLTQWVERALAGNLDVAIAFERVEQAQALLRSASAQRGVIVAGRAQAGITQRRSSAATTGVIGAAGTAGTGGPTATGGSGSVSAGLTLDWDSDLWGGQRLAERSAAASLLRSQDLIQVSRLNTAGLAARGYITWREVQQEYTLLREALRVREETLRVVEVRVDVGLAPSLDLARAQADLAAVRGDLDDAASRTRQAMLALQVLTGQRPSVPAQASVPASGQPPSIPQLPAAPPVPRPIDLLRLRPDVRAAEHALIAAFADIGVARSELYPQLRLPGELLLAGGGLGTGTIVRTLTAGLSALLQVSLFDGGQRAAQVDAAQSRAREAALLYRRTVLEALEQVETALLAVQVVDSQRTARIAAADASETALQQARALYTEGLTGFLDVLEAQRTWLANRMELMRIEAAAARAAIAVFEATGLIDAPDDASIAESLRNEKDARR